MKIKRSKRIILANQEPTIKQLDDLAREYVRLRDHGCQRCGATSGKLETAHFYSRAIKSTRWDVDDNLCLLCFKDHYCWAHREPKEFADWWEQRIGRARFQRLQMRRHDTSKVDRSAVKIYLLQKIKELTIKESK